MLTSSEANRSNRSETDETRKNGVLLGLIRAVSSPKYFFFFKKFSNRRLFFKTVLVSTFNFLKSHYIIITINTFRRIAINFILKQIIVSLRCFL
jgi:hypothetical protein